MKIKIVFIAIFYSGVIDPSPPHTHHQHHHHHPPINSGGDTRKLLIEQGLPDSIMYLFEKQNICLILHD